MTVALAETRRLAISLGGRPILHDVNLTINAGEIITIVGPNGSGKSTLLRALVGAAALNSGSIERRSGLRIGYVPQRLHIDGTMPITVRRFMNAAKAASIEALDEVGALPLINRQMSDLSGGQFQRVLLARALTRQPELLLLDEPTQGLDQPGSAAFYRLIEAVRARTGCAIVMVSHDLHVVMSASDRVICLNGHICCEGAPSVVSTAPEYRALFGLGTKGALALYQHEHDHGHEHEHEHEHEHGSTDA
jgi:zinc transport system ATP-binding protein